MINFINEHWLAIIIYLVGCILAWGRINGAAAKNNAKADISVIVICIFSWIVFFVGLIVWVDKGGKFFKWLPILLLWCMVGVGCDTREKALQQHATNVKVWGAGNLIVKGPINMTEVYLVEIDTCQYLYAKWGNGTWVTHKGNCNNPIHNK